MFSARALRSSAVLGLLAASFVACGGSTSGLFSGVGGSGASAAGGDATASGGSAASGGERTGTGGAMHTGTAGASSGGHSATGGSGSGSSGANEGGSNASGGGTGEGGVGGSAIGGTSSGGSAGTTSAGSNAGGNAAGGSSNGGAANAGTGGTANLTCSDLLALASKELTAAQACDNSRDALSCTGRVDTTCGCAVPVDQQTSQATAAYLATLKTLQARRCVTICPAIACLPISRAQCSQQGGGTGTCVAQRGPVTQ